MDNKELLKVIKMAIHSLEDVEKIKSINIWIKAPSKKIRVSKDVMELLWEDFVKEFWLEEN